MADSHRRGVYGLSGNGVPPIIAELVQRLNGALPVHDGELLLLPQPGIEIASISSSAMSRGFMR